MHRSWSVYLFSYLSNNCTQPLPDMLLVGGKLEAVYNLGWITSAVGERTPPSCPFSCRETKIGLMKRAEIEPRGSYVN